MLAEVGLEADTGRYGESLSEAMHPGANPADYSSGYVYVAHGPDTNWAERAAAEAEDEWRRENLAEGERMPAGMRWTVTKQTYTPVLEGEVIEVQREQAAYGEPSAAPGGDAPDASHSGDGEPGE